MTEKELIEKLRKIERLFSGATTEGERDAAANAMGRLQERIGTPPRDFQEKPTEYRFSLGDLWNRKLFLALLRRYEIKPYRRPRQRHTTVMARVQKSFVDSILWPEFKELSKVLAEYIDEITDSVIREHIFSDTSEAEVADQPFELQG